MDNLVQEVYSAVLNGNASEVKEKVQLALDNGTEAETILNSGLIAAMKEVGQLFEDGGDPRSGNVDFCASDAIRDDNPPPSPGSPGYQTDWESCHWYRQRRPA